VEIMVESGGGEYMPISPEFKYSPQNRRYFQ
jgi:hypothetical protein